LEAGHLAKNPWWEASDQYLGGPAQTNNLKHNLMIRQGCSKAYLLDQHIENFFQGHLGGVREEDDEGEDSLILMSLVDLLMVVLAFFGGGGGAAALCLPTLVVEDLTLGLTVKSSADSPLGVWAEIRMAEIGISPSNLGIDEMKLSRAYIHRYGE
jgi:hypothetical protein